MTDPHQDELIPRGPSLVRACFGTEPRRLAFVGAFVLGVMIVVTGGYVLVGGGCRAGAGPRAGCRTLRGSMTGPCAL